MTVSEPAPTLSADEGFDLEDFGAEWREVMANLATADGVTVEPGDEVMEDGRVVDLDLATVRKGDHVLRLVDDAQSTAVTVAHALAKQGHAVLRAKATESGLVERILAALGE